MNHPKQRLKIRYAGVIKHISISMLMLIFSFLPKKLLLSIAKKKSRELVNDKYTDILYCFSGRSALSTLLSDLKHKGDILSVLLPDYICNVVYESAKYCELNIIYYRIDASYRPDYDDILIKMKNRPSTAIVLPSYLNRVIKYMDVVAAIRRMHASCPIIFDECQNLLNSHSIPMFDENCYIISSYNNKMTYGLLGGVIFASRTVSTANVKRVTLIEETKMRLLFVKMMLKDAVSLIMAGGGLNHQMLKYQCVSADTA